MSIMKKVLLLKLIKIQRLKFKGALLTKMALKMDFLLKLCLTIQKLLEFLILTRNSENFKN